MYRIVTKFPEINALDLSMIQERFLDPDVNLLGLKWKEEDVLALTEQYKAFLALKKTYPDEVIVPFRELDEFWHQHILFTKKYTADCLAIFGEYAHHTPHKQKSAEDREFYQTNYERTLELLAKEFPDAV